MPKARRRNVHRSERFDEMALPAELIDVLHEQGLSHAFEIQSAILPDALAGRDVLARAETGSGKTLAFTLAMTARFRGRKVHRGRPLGVVLVPTRELATQVVDTIHPFARAVGIKAQLVAGGMNLDKQADAVFRGVQIVVGTPGRLIDLGMRGALDLDRVETTVIDEADHMVDLGFWPQVREIVAATPMGTQKMLFSATLDGPQVQDLVDAFMVDPVEHQTVPVAAAVSTMSHHVLAIEPSVKRPVTAMLAGVKGRILMFTRTQLGAERVAAELVEVGVPAAALHGSKQQGIRTNVLAGFRQGAFNVLVATDVAARGLHIDDVAMVVHVDPPDTAKDYVHRSGRTARAGASGVVVTLALPHQTEPMSELLREAKVEPRTEPVADMRAPILAELGAAEPSGTSVPDPALTKYKGAPRKFKVGSTSGANQQRAQQRRLNEQRRAAWENDDRAENGGKSRGTRGGGRSTQGSGKRGAGTQSKRPHGGGKHGGGKQGAGNAGGRTRGSGSRHQGPSTRGRKGRSR